MRLGQNFLADANLLDAIVRDAELRPADVVLEIGGGEGALTERLAPMASVLHVIELDERLRERLEELAAREGSVRLAFGDAMRIHLDALDPPPTAVVSNLPYSVATPVLLRTIAELPGLERWTVMVQREIADRLRAEPGTKAYGAPSVLTQLACRVELRRPVDPAVFRPRPRVASALLRLDRVGPWAGEGTARIVRAAFAHRRKALARSVATAGAGSRERVLQALETLGIAPAARAEELEPADFVRLAEELAR